MVTKRPAPVEGRLWPTAHEGSPTVALKHKRPRQPSDGRQSRVPMMYPRSSIDHGLGAAKAARRFVTYGPNEPAPVRRLSAVVQLFHLFANPLVVILLVASGISASLGQRIDALIIVTMVVLGVAINFWQSYRSPRAAERLRASVNPTATVLRDG